MCINLALTLTAGPALLQSASVTYWYTVYSKLQDGLMHLV